MDKDMDGMMENIVDDKNMLDPMAEPSGTVARTVAGVMVKEDGLARDVKKMKVERDMLRREADALDREIREIEQRELDLIKARNGRIVWEKRLGCVEVEKGLEIGGVEIRNHREIEVVARMFREIEENRK